jgi:N-acetylmuramoyl-L-alanine amidase
VPLRLFAFGVIVSWPTVYDKVGGSLKKLLALQVPSEDYSCSEVKLVTEVRGTVVIDPGHGGTRIIGGSDANHAVSPSGVLEKNLTLQIAQEALNALAGVAPKVRVILTRSGDVNLSRADRAKVASTNKANLFLSIHFNGFNKSARGVEAFVRTAASNVNTAEDTRFAERVKTAVLAAIKARDPQTKDRGVKQMNLGVLADSSLGNTAANHKTRSCLLEVEFMDVTAVDVLFNTGPNAADVRREVGQAIAGVIVADLQTKVLGVSA